MFMFLSLLQRGDVSVVYASNRPSKEAASKEQRQESGFDGRSLDVTVLR
jgi:hypothetical protein